MILRYCSAYLGLLSWLAAAIAHAAITLAPASPTPMDMITINKPFDNEDIAKTVVSMSNNHITVSFTSLDVFFPEPPPGTLVQPIGRLPPGMYQVDVVRADASSPTTPLASFNVTVAPRAAGQPVDDYTDIWWNPDESGWGLGIAQHADGQLFATWFAYAADGSPNWYVVPGGQWVGDRTFEGDVYRTGGPTDMAHFSADAVTRTKVGNASFIFGPSSLDMVITVDGKSVTRSLQRQSF